MSFTYTNRKGSTYYLCQATTKTGKMRYYFAREPKDTPVEKLLDGYQVEESVNGVVSVAKARPQLISPEELACIEADLKKLSKSHKYRAVIKNDQIWIYESQGVDLGDLIGNMGWNVPSGFEQNLLERHVQFSPIMRFILEEPEERIFSPQRWCFRGSIDEWIDIQSPAKIEVLAKNLLPTLGTDDFFELY
ncbi:MAG: hypothetical protein NTW32_00235 [Chloroflexi bacterium]|nr:hypothetical protein [Chloroflexota bacterium]